MYLAMDVKVRLYQLDMDSSPALVHIVKRDADRTPIGSIIPVAAGRMRNEFYPKKMADYVTKAQLRELGMENVELERDSTFGLGQQQAAPTTEPEEAIKPNIAIHTDLLKVSHHIRSYWTVIY
jgi:hypothetical protein